MFAYVGSRTTRERNARGDGISVFSAMLRRAHWCWFKFLAIL